jgi:hypothetical protein
VVFRPADILGIPQAIKGFDKPDFVTYSQCIPKDARSEVTIGYLKNGFDLIFIGFNGFQVVVIRFMFAAKKTS